MEIEIEEETAIVGRERQRFPSLVSYDTGDRD